MERPAVIRVDPGAAMDELRRLLRGAARAAASGGLVVYPTDTLYGLGTNPLLEEALERLFRAKERPPERPVPVLGSSIEALERIVAFTPLARRLAERFWPGPLTVILPVRPGAAVPRLLHAGTGRIGVRVPGHRVALALIEEAGGLLTGTSANIHRRPPARTAAEALEQLDGRVDYVVDAGPAPLGKPSTVVDLSVEPPRLVREGAVPREEIERVLGKRLST